MLSKSCQEIGRCPALEQFFRGGNINFNVNCTFRQNSLLVAGSNRRRVGKHCEKRASGDEHLVEDESDPVTTCCKSPKRGELEVSSSSTHQVGQN